MVSWYVLLSCHSYTYATSYIILNKKVVDISNRKQQKQENNKNKNVLSYFFSAPKAIIMYKKECTTIHAKVVERTCARICLGYQGMYVATVDYD